MVLTAEFTIQIAIFEESDDDLSSLTPFTRPAYYIN